MKKKKLKRVSALVLSLVMALSLTSLPVYAAEMESGAVDLTVNSSKVAFANYEWWVIGYNEEGVYPQTGHITLLSANNEFGTTVFRSDNNDIYSSTRNEYAGSTLQQYMVSIANGFSEKEQNVITARTLIGEGTYASPSDDGIAGDTVYDQKLWALSYDEWDTINDNEVRSYGGSYYYWLRSPHSTSGNYARLGHHSGSLTGGGIVNDESIAARPAFSLNLESVIFTSAASDSGKSTAVGEGLTSMEGIDSSSTVKFTMIDSSQTLAVNATEEQSTQTGSMLYFTYEGATTGPNQYISSVLTDEDGDVVYYGKLADSSSASSGELSISLAGVEAGTYTLKIFSEQANDYLYTDFCSEPVTMTVTVSGSSGEVSEFDGNLVDDQSTDEKDNNQENDQTTSDDSEAENDQDDSQTTSTVENPKTYDNIFLYFVLGTISIIGLISAGIYFRKNMKNKTR